MPLVQKTHGRNQADGLTRRAQPGDFLAYANFRWANLHLAPRCSLPAFTPPHEAPQERFAATKWPMGVVFWCEKYREVGFCNWEVGTTSLFAPS